MKNILCSVGLLSAVLLGTGCDSSTMAARNNQNGYGFLLNELSRTTNPPAASSSVQTPIRLAVADVGELAATAGFLNRLNQPDVVREIVALPVPFVGDGWKTSNAPASALLDLAQHAGANYLLLVGKDITLHDSRTPLSVFDVTLVGAAIVPGLKLNAEGHASAALIEVPSGRLVFLVNAEAKKSKLAPSFYSDGEGETLSYTTRDVLLQNLADKVVAHLRASRAAGS